MYPRNAASPERVSIGAVVQISDGAVQTSGCTVRILPSGGAEGDGAGTTAYSTDGVVLYTPTQAETNYASFVLIAKKSGCIPATVTIVTTASATAGKVDVGAFGGTAVTGRDIGASVLLSSGTGTGQVSLSSGTVTVGTNNDKTGYTASTVSDKTGYSLSASPPTAAEIKTAVEAAGSHLALIKAKTDYLPSATAGSAGGVFIAGSNAATSVTTALTANITGNLSGSVGSVTGAVASVTGNVGGNVAGSVNSVTAGVTVTTNNDKTGYSLSAAGIQAVWDALTSALTTVGSIGKRLVDYLTGDTYARLGAPAGASISADVAAVKSQTAAIETDTQDLQTQIGTAGAGLTAIGDTRVANLDATVSSRLATSGYTAPPTVGQVADQVWDEAISGHTGAGSTGNALSTASSGGVDPSVLADAIWDEVISGHTNSGSAGKILGDNLNAPVGTVDTVVDAIKAKTDNLPASPAAVGSQMDLVNAPNATAVAAIQNGLATPTNITAGTITTVTNLTNAPTSGDLTATMKASVTAAVPTTSQIKTAMEVDGGKLDHLWEMTEDDGGVRRLTENALEQAPGGSSGGDATAENQTTIITHLTDIKGTGFVKDTNSMTNVTAGTELTLVEESTVIQD